MPALWQTDTHSLIDDIFQDTARGYESDIKSLTLHADSVEADIKRINKKLDASEVAFYSTFTSSIFCIKAHPFGVLCNIFRMGSKVIYAQ